MHVLNCEIMGNWTSIMQLLYHLVSLLFLSVDTRPNQADDWLFVFRLLCAVWLCCEEILCVENTYHTFSQIIVIIACHGVEVPCRKYIAIVSAEIILIIVDAVPCVMQYGCCEKSVQQSLCFLHLYVVQETKATWKTLTLVNWSSGCNETAG